MNNKRKFLVLSFICLILFSVAPVLANTTDDGYSNSTNENNTIDNTTIPPTVNFTAVVSNTSDTSTTTNASSNDSNIPSVVPTTPCACPLDNISNISKTDNCTNNTTLKPTCNVSKVPANLRVLCHGPAPRRVHFIDRSKKHVSTYWNLGDGTTSRCKSITHIYKTPGKYLVKFTVKYRSGIVKTFNGGYIVVTGSSAPVVNDTTNTTQQTPVTTPTPEITPTPTPTPIVTPTPEPTPTVTPTPSSQVIASWTGNTNKNTETFHISSDQWKISWILPAEHSGFGYFTIAVYNSDGSYKDLAANGLDSGSTIERGSGNYYLVISTGEPYTITVEQ